MIDSLGNGDHLPEGPAPEIHPLPAGADACALVESILARWKKSGLCDPSEVLILHAQSTLAKSPLGDRGVLAGRNLRECTEEEDSPDCIRHTSILKAKLANAALIDQEGRQDVKHARMMLLCVHAFIVELSGKCRAGLLGERALVNLLGEIWDILSSPVAMKAAELWGFDFTALWPVDGLKSLGEGKVSRWLQHRFPENPT